ncbi:MAG: helix-turn-helix domain-containing protein [Pirellulales bacterium]
MSSNFIPLEEAAKRLGVSSEELVEMRSRGDIFGYRDGASWKFKPEEIERVANEVLGDAIDEDPAGSSILMGEPDLGTSGSKLGSAIGSDIGLSGGSPDIDSDVALVPDPGGGSDVKLVAGRSGIKKSDDDDLVLADDTPKSKKPSAGSSNRLGSDLKLAKDDDDDDELQLASDDDDLASLSGSGVKGGGSDVEIGSDLGLGSDVLAGLSPVSNPKSGQSDKLISGDSDPSLGSGISLGSDLELSDDDDLVLGGGSDLAIGNDSGINLMSPSDSGISLEDEPLDLAGSGISGLDLAAEGSDAGAAASSAAGSGIEFSQGEEFQLSPAGMAEGDDDSGSQVIELEDSSEFGDAAVALPAADGGFGDAGFGSGTDDGFGGATMGGTSSGSAPVAMATPEVPFTTGQVVVLLGILMLMCMSGILVTDITRNMWQWSDGASDLTSGFTSTILSAFGQK